MGECKYGCGEQGSHTLKNGGLCCSEYSTQCVVNRKKNSKKNKEIYLGGRNVVFTDEHRKKSHISLINNLKNKPFHLWGKKLIRETVLTEQDGGCEICGVSDWNNKPITLEIDHIDGNHDNNRRNNLRALCPNCHSQTDNYRGKNINKSKTKVTDDEIIEGLIKNGGVISLTLKELNLTPKGGNYIRAKSLINYNPKLTTIKELLESKKNNKKVVKPKPKMKMKMNFCGCGCVIENKSKRCKNCWSLEQRKVDRPKREQLLEDVENLGYCGSGRKYKVSDNTIRKWVKYGEKH